MRAMKRIINIETGVEKFIRNQQTGNPLFVRLGSVNFQYSRLSNNQKQDTIKQ